MNIADVEKFLGLPAQNADFDNYLNAHGISYRPVYKETPVDRINQREEGVTLCFDCKHSYQRTHGPLREDGEMIFSSLQAYGAVNNSGFTQYSGPLPYNLSFETTVEEAVAILGQATVHHPSGNHHVYVWDGYQGRTMALCFLADDKGVSFFSLERAAITPPRRSKLGI